MSTNTPKEARSFIDQTKIGEYAPQQPLSGVVSVGSVQVSYVRTADDKPASEEANAKKSA